MGEGDGKPNMEQLTSGTTLATQGSSIKDNQEGAVPRADGHANANICCYECNQYGHYANQCPKLMTVTVKWDNKTLQ